MSPTNPFTPEYSPGAMSTDTTDSSTLPVRHMRMALLWPVRLTPPASQTTVQHQGQRQDDWLRPLVQHPCWKEQHDEYTGDSSSFHERHYNEFVSFLPYVQRFLYGDRRQGVHGDAQLRVFRRQDVTALQVVLRQGEAPLRLEVVHTDLYFFFDVDIAVLNVELAIDGLSLAQVQEVHYRVGRAYPSGWDEHGLPTHNAHEMQWLDAQGQLLAQSDAGQRELFLSHVAQQRCPRISAHWAWLMQPLLPRYHEDNTSLRYEQIEYYRMPLMAYLALDNPHALEMQDFARLGLVMGATSAPDEQRFTPQQLTDFQTQHCMDRFWGHGGAAPHTRYLCTGHALIVIGRADSTYYRCRDRGVLAQFRHQHFLLFLIAHFQKASLLMFSDRLVEALSELDIYSASSVKQFKRRVRASFERFLRFTHRYWFHEISEQAQVRLLFQMCASQLKLDPLYAEVRERIGDMNTYLEVDNLRRQANTVMRLTVVTMFGLIGTVTTGFLGMNLLAEADTPLPRKLLWFAVVGGLTTWLTFYTLIKSKQLTDFLDAMSNERETWRGKWVAFQKVWGRRR